jgi:uncharacterized protein DUF4383
MPRMLSHMPVDHHLRPLYRFLTVVTGAYVLLFGIIGVIQTSGEGFFDRADVSVLGLRTNLAFAIASIVAGVVLIGAVFIGRNVDTTVAFWGGLAYMVAGMAMLAFLNTHDLNVLNSTIATVAVSFAIGTLLFTAGMYTRSSGRAVAPATEAAEA